MRLLWAFVLLSVSSSLFAADVDAILRDRISVRKAATAIAAAVVTPEGTRFFHSGGADENTLFRVASATKVFTSVLLADMIARGEVALDDPVAKYLPPGTILPASRRPITLRDLATHRAGLPNMPSNFRDDGEYGEKELYAFLAKCRLESEPGDAFHYSNAGMAILGLALTRRANSAQMQGDTPAYGNAQSEGQGKDVCGGVRRATQEHARAARPDAGAARRHGWHHGFARIRVRERALRAAARESGKAGGGVGSHTRRAHWT